MSKSHQITKIKQAETGSCCDINTIILKATLPIIRFVI